MKKRYSSLFALLSLPGHKSHADIIPMEYDYGYQVYQEDNERMRVEAHYVRAKIDISDGTSLRFQWLNDAISGASPTGAQPGGLQPFTAEVEDIRTGILGAISQRIGNNKVELEVSQSNEDDYYSQGIALSDAIELNQKNTTVSFGVNYLDDDVTVPILGLKKKETYDFFTGVSQILSKNTIVSANLTLGWSKGYLNDPYKAVERNEIVTTPDTIIDLGDGTTMTIPGVEVPVVNIYKENRPAERFRQVLQLEATHYFEAENAAINVVGRISHDDYGVNSQTLQAEWRQDIGSHLQLVPYVRYYHQNAANFFVNTLNNVPVEVPSQDPDGTGPFYSSDYRLSSFDAVSLGMRLRMTITENLALSAAYERYTMKGTGEDVAPGAAYPSANMFTVGMTLSF